MTIQEKKEYLKQYLAIVHNIQTIELQIEEVRNMMTSIGGIDYSKDRVQTSPKDSMLENYAKLDSLERKLIHKINERQARLKDIIECIDRLVNKEEQDVLTYRYIKGFEWEDIAQCMYRSKRSVLYIHGDALKNFAIETK